ncbi:MAG: DUF4381 domain-containing protein [Halopseudomonas sp.]
MTTPLSSSSPAQPFAQPITAPPAGAPVSLEQLRDLQLPDPIGFWPPAPGWWLLAVLSLALLCWLGLTAYRYIRRNRYRKQALRELARLSANAQQLTPLQWLQQLNQLLRRTALAAYPPELVAQLSGDDWTNFLYRSSQLEGFRQATGASLANGPYQPLLPNQGSVDTESLQQLARQWIRQHKQGAIDADA